MSSDTFSQCQYCLARHSCAFSDLPDGVRRGLQAIAGTKFYARHQHAVREGDEAHGLYIVKSGVVRLYCLTPSGKATASLPPPQPEQTVDCPPDGCYRLQLSVAWQDHSAMDRGSRSTPIA